MISNNQCEAECNNLCLAMFNLSKEALVLVDRDLNILDSNRAFKALSRVFNIKDKQSILDFINLSTTEVLGLKNQHRSLLGKTTNLTVHEARGIPVALDIHSIFTHEGEEAYLLSFFPKTTEYHFILDSTTEQKTNSNKKTILAFSIALIIIFILLTFWITSVVPNKNTIKQQEFSRQPVITQEDLNANL